MKRQDTYRATCEQREYYQCGSCWRTSAGKHVVLYIGMPGYTLCVTCAAQLERALAAAVKEAGTT